MTFDEYIPFLLLFFPTRGNQSMLDASIDLARPDETLITADRKRELADPELC